MDEIAEVTSTLFYVHSGFRRAVIHSSCCNPNAAVKACRILLLVKSEEPISQHGTPRKVARRGIFDAGFSTVRPGDGAPGGRS